MKEILSIGSNVRLKRDETLLITIIGYGVIIQDIKYDYSGVVNPFGLMASGRIVGFNHSDIYKIESFGYKNEKFNMLKRFFCKYNDMNTGKSSVDK